MPLDVEIYTTCSPVMFRFFIQRRKKDNPTDVARRTLKYHNEAEKVVDLYKEGAVRRFNAMRPIAEVLSDITTWLDDYYYPKA